MLEARVESNFPFLGKMRTVGDVITSAELDQTSKTVRDALVSQKLVTLVGAESEKAGRKAVRQSKSDASGDDLGALHARMDNIEAKLDRALGMLAARPKVKKARKAPARKSADEAAAE